MIDKIRKLLCMAVIKEKIKWFNCQLYVIIKENCLFSFYLHAYI